MATRKGRKGPVALHVAKRAILFLLTGSATLFLSACYGVGQMFRWVNVRTLDPEGRPVPGIRIQSPLMAGQEIRTDAYGEASCGDLGADDPALRADLLFTDDDGTANGGTFAQKTESVGGGFAEVTLERLP